MNKIIYRDFLKSVLLSYSQIFFSYSQIMGFLLLLITFFSPLIGAAGLLSVIISNSLAYLFNYGKETIEKGYLGFNSLLIGMEVAYFFKPSFATFILLFTLVITTFFLTVVLNHIFYSYLAIPSLTLPFVLVSIVFYFATYNYTGLTLQDSSFTAFKSIGFLSDFPIIESFFKSLSIIFFQSNIISGILIALILLLYSPSMLFLALISFYAGLFFYQIMGGSLIGVENAFVGFNFIFAGLAIGGIFFVPSVSSYLLLIFTVLVTALLSSAIKTFVIFYKMPVFALPFNLVVFMVLLAFKQRGKDMFPKLVDFIPGKPEDNLNFYLKNIKRFGSFLITKNLALPIKGVWKISQGANGKETHKDRWRWALDFQKLNYDKEVYDNDGNLVQDYPTYQETVYSPVNGIIAAIENSVEDNKIGEVNIKQNWGNFIIINAGYGVYVKLAHLLKDSIKVKTGQTVKTGEELAKIGNSGRSAYPHLHFQVQVLPVIGADTIEFSFASYILHSENSKKIEIQKLPKTNDIIESWEKDENYEEVFNLYMNRKFKYTYNQIKEEIKVDIDFYGRKFLLSEKAKLYFNKTETFFYFLDFEGDKNSVLYYFYKNISSIPLKYSENLTWKENIYFSPSGIFKDFITFVYSFIRPPYKELNFKYGKKGRFKNELSYVIHSENKKIILNENKFIFAVKEDDNIILENED